MDGRKRAGITALGRAASKPAKRGFANRQAAFIVMSFMAGFIAARVHTPDQKHPCDAAKNGQRKPLSQSL